MRKISNHHFLMIIMILILLVAGCGKPSEDKAAAVTPNTEIAQAIAKPPVSTAVTGVSGKLIVHFIDVGQGDCELLQLPNGQNMLIDASTNEAGPTIVAYLNSQGVKKIDYLVATHPHENHIGGMDNVIKSIDIDRIYMPKVTNTTKSFENVLNIIKAKGLKVIPSQAGMTIFNQDGLKINYLAPGGTAYEDLNNWSIVTRVQFANNSFLFTGDAEEKSEYEMLNSGADLHADILKVGHHGSQSSTTASFLQAVAPPLCSNIIRSRE